MDNGLINPEAGDILMFPASLGQERFWGLDRLNIGNPTWNVPVRFRLQGALDPVIVERAFNEIVNRHESLRATFSLIDGQLSQIVKHSLRIDVPLTDLRSLPKADQDVAVDRLSYEEARRRFDLTTGPLFRVSLLRIEDFEHVLLVTPHHSVADYWSIGLVSNELGALYEAFTRGVDPILPELPIQYGDFSVWQHEQIDNALVQNELAYWENQLENLPLLDIPTDRPRGSSPTYEATISSILLPLKLTDAIKDIANRAGATFFNTTLAALGVLLHQYTGQSDFGVGTQVAGRNTVELESLIGVFINNVVLRMDLTGDPLFPQLLGRTQDVGLQSLANQNVRFEQVLKSLRPTDYPSHHTLFRVNFICQRDPVKPLEFSGIKLTVIPSKSQGALYDLNVFLVLRTEGWRLACEYNADLFEADTITRLLADYRRLLECIADNPNRRLSEFPLPEGAPRPRPEHRPLAKPGSQATTSGLATPRQTATRTNSLIDDPVERYAMPASAAQRRFWVLEELAPGNPALHMRACVRLIGSLSVPILEKSLQYLVNRHETLRTTFEQVDEEIIQLIAPSSKVVVALTSLDDVPEADREQRLWEAIRAEASTAFDLARGPLIRSRLFRLLPEEHVLVISTHHIITDGWSQNVIQREMWATYEAIADGREPSLQPLAIQYGDFVHWQHNWLGSDEARGHIDFWTKRLAAPLPVLDLPIDRPATNGAAPEEPMQTLLLPEDLARSLKDLSQSHDASMFMVMLTAFGAMLNRCTGQEEILIGSPMANRRSETESLIGPFAGPVTLRLNLSGNPTLRELLARVRDVTLEALSHADLPFEELLEKLHIPSVRGRNPLTQCYFFYQKAFLQPRELRGLAVTPLPDFGLGTHFELQMGLLERREGIRAQLEYNPGLFKAAVIKNILISYESVLRAFVSDPELRLSGLPLSIDTRIEPPSPSMAFQSETTIPQDETEKQLTTIWEEVLRVHPISRHHNYFELGGTSLLAVRLFARIEKVFGIKIPLSVLIGTQTIEAFARVLRATDTAAKWSPLVEIQKGGSRPPLFCVHGGGGNVLLYRDLSRRLGPDQTFYGLQAQGLDGKQPLLTRIEDMAARYLKDVQRLQPNGPYLLGGYCMGGTVAFEMAQQLTAQGQQVALLALFDTVNWSQLGPSTAWNKLYFQIQRLLFHAQNFLLLSFEDKITFFRQKMTSVRNRLSVWRGMFLRKLPDDWRGTGHDSLQLARIWENNDRASLKYVPHPYSGAITDFRPITQYARYEQSGAGWSDLALKGQQTITLPVYPAGMLLEPFVKHLAAALKTSINNALPKPFATSDEGVDHRLSNDGRDPAESLTCQITAATEEGQHRLSSSRIIASGPDYVLAGRKA